MADLIAEGARMLTFVRSRRGAELTALGARARLAEAGWTVQEGVLKNAEGAPFAPRDEKGRIRAELIAAQKAALGL